MSANLVNYDSSPGEEETDDDDNDNDDSVIVNKDEKEVNNYFFQQPTSNQMSSSSSSSDDDDHFRKRYRPTTTDCSIALPTALSALRQTHSSTIFVTEQSAEEAASQAILEQHVKLTEKAVPSSSSTARSRAPICRAFKNGRCNRGDQCRFLHSLVRPTKSTDSIEPTLPAFEFSSSAVVYNDWEQEEKTTAKKRRQSGVTNTLLPTKKAMRIFEKHKKTD